MQTFARRLGPPAVEAYPEFKADRIIAERDFGGAMVRHVIKTVEKSVSYKEVTASRGKIARAEPVAALYEQGRVKHAGSFPELEDEMCAMAPEGYVGDGSPDRADAAIWALTELMIQPFSSGCFGFVWALLGRGAFASCAGGRGLVRAVHNFMRS